MHVVDYHVSPQSWSPVHSRYAVRLLYDEGSLGEVESASELAEYLQDYDRNYFIGCESESGWEEAISREKPNLFSLGRDPEKVGWITVQELSVHSHVISIHELARPLKCLGTRLQSCI